MNKDNKKDIISNLKDDIKMDITPKKRGRKPKIKVEENNNELPEIKIPKKRGRKPKPKPENTDDNLEQHKIPKKRGRKPKINIKNIEHKKKITNDEAIILHIPIKENIILNMNDDYNNDGKVIIPKPYNISNYIHINSPTCTSIHEDVSIHTYGCIYTYTHIYIYIYIY